MPVKNALTKQEPKKNELRYIAGGAEITLTPEIVKGYLVSGDRDKVTTQELVMFMNLCKYSGLNPWAKEAYCIKYGTNPATMVVGKDAYTKRADANSNYDGIEAGIILQNEDGELIYRPGTMKLKNEELVGGWAEVYRKDRSHPCRMEVSFDEYAAKRRDGSLNDQWSKKPATMIRKVAYVQALRESFPSAFGGMYAAEEVGYDSEPEVNFTANETMTGPAPEAQPDLIEERTPATAPSATFDQEYEPAPAPKATSAAAALFGGR